MFEVGKKVIVDVDSVDFVGTIIVGKHQVLEGEYVLVAKWVNTSFLLEDDGADVGIPVDATTKDIVQIPISAV